VAKPTDDLTGLLLIDKPGGWTSHDVVAKARGITGRRRIGHTGTLDPMATGLLVLCLGRATRLVEYLTSHAKHYEGEIQLGVATDTDDAQGAVIARHSVPALSASDLSDVAKRFLGEHHQVPPAYSAIKIRGQRAYAAARSGSPLNLPSRSVVVHELTLAQISDDRLSISVHCGAGTYVRSLARDIGGALGCGGHLATLRRTRAGKLDVAGAVSLEHLAMHTAAGRLSELLLPMDEGIIDHEAAILTNEHGRQLATGVPVHVETAERAVSSARIYTADGRFVAVAEVSSAGQIKPRKVLLDPW
jgi:tRNA pseudouridine55 synthase